MRLKSHKDLIVFKSAIKLAIRIHQLSKNFPNEEKYSLTDQIRRSSRSVAANIAEAFRKRRYPKSFISKLSDSEGEAAETQVWLYFIETFEYLDSSVTEDIDAQYEHLLAQLVTMIQSPEKWSM
ncbi:MAG: four helix bundle protein [Bacteroidetes bacterium]|nr:four helix bundle protein [Bacteroidota bacterium]MCL6103812.1 four helix bundle protein [Bacteroidota bacterium]